MNLFEIKRLLSYVICWLNRVNDQQCRVLVVDIGSTLLLCLFKLDNAVIEILKFKARVNAKIS